MSIAQGHTQALASRGIISLLSAPSPDDPVTLRLHESARRMIGIAIFSGVVNVLMLSGSLYMLQMYDRVIPSRNLSTLLGLWLRRIRQHLPLRAQIHRGRGRAARQPFGQQRHHRRRGRRRGRLADFTQTNQPLTRRDELLPGAERDFDRRQRAAHHDR